MMQRKNLKEQNHPLKVAWICHFSNQEVRERLPLSNMWFINTIKKLLVKPNSEYSDFAPWVTNLIKEFEKFNNVELHIIAPHKSLSRLTYHFEMNGVFYHFFKPDLPILHSNLPLNKNKKYKRNRFFVKRFLKRIKPDIVNLIGSENPYYSITSLDIKNIPVFVSAQTVYTNPERKKHSSTISQHRWDIELQIHKKEKYFGCKGKMHRDLILQNNPEAIIMHRNFAPKIIPQPKPTSKKFDFVFFAASVTAKKGAEDAIEALAISKREKQDVTLNIVGKCNANYKSRLNQKINELNLNENIVFTDHFPLYSDLLQHIIQSKFALLPVKMDVISGTIMESMALGLPVVTYKTSGTPTLNKDKESVLLADIGDADTLAKQMLKLLNSPELSEKLKNNARSVVEKRLENNNAAENLVKNYKAIINHFHYNIPIPQELLYDGNDH